MTNVCSRQGHERITRLRMDKPRGERKCEDRSINVPQKCMMYYQEAGSIYVYACMSRAHDDVIIIVEGGGSACNCQKFEKGRISRVY